MIFWGRKKLRSRSIGEKEDCWLPTGVKDKCFGNSLKCNVCASPY